MSKFLYARLAAVNIRKNGRIFAPYILISIFTIAMFYIMVFIAGNEGVSKMPGAQALSVILVMGSVVIGIFSFIILLYTNSFLMKRRLKEIGLYNILGMGKRHIARVMSIETIFVALFTIVTGLLTGILLSKLMLALLLKLLTFTVPFGFEISPVALGVTALLFAGIFFATLLINLGRIGLSKPIELLYGGNVGEKEPKTKRLLAVIGFIALAVGYTIANVTDNPLQALGLFFIAVILAILGTFCLFTAGSIAVLKALRKNKGYYYKTKHFTSVSGMIYRMKQNAAGLANICILSTMVLVMLSTTVSLYIGMEDALRSRFPKSFEITVPHLSRDDADALERTIDRILTENKTAVRNVACYRYEGWTMTESGSRFTLLNEFIVTTPAGFTVIFIPLEDYNRLQGKAASLAEDELLLHISKGSYDGDSVSFGAAVYRIREKLPDLNVPEKYALSLNEVFYFIVPGEQTVRDIYAALGGTEWNGLSFYCGFDADGDGPSQRALAETLRRTLNTAGGEDVPVYVTNAEENRYTFLSVYGGLFFLGIFLGALFVMATVIIMYYKQMSEGYDDKKRFEIMQKVGLGREKIKATIRSQVLTVFFLPLAAAGIHIVAAFKMITKLLYLLNLNNVHLFAVCTLGTFALFAVVYAAVYALTARTYYRIVS